MSVPKYKHSIEWYCSGCQKRLGGIDEDPPPHEAAECIPTLNKEREYVWDRIQELEDRLGKLERKADR